MKSMEAANVRASGFDYDAAFSRNLGLVTEEEQGRLQNICVGLPGLGGVGGSHLQALARLGIGKFHLSDLDTFEVANFNRQLGADMRTVSRPKLDVMTDAALAINPEASVEKFPGGINAVNMGAFLDGVDVVVDGLEFFAIETRRLLFKSCRERGIPVITAGPIGYGAAVLVFMPDGMSFDEYFRIQDGMTRTEQLMAFGFGLAPGMGGGVDPKYVDFEKQKGPALISACFMCSAAAATEVLKLVCGRGSLAVAPNGIYMDPYRMRMGKLRPKPSLARGILGKIIRFVAFRRFPALRTMHERELALRGGGEPVGNSVEGWSGEVELSQPRE